MSRNVRSCERRVQNWLDKYKKDGSFLMRGVGGFGFDQASKNVSMNAYTPMTARFDFDSIGFSASLGTFFPSRIDKDEIVPHHTVQIV